MDVIHTLRRQVQVKHGVYALSNSTIQTRNTSNMVSSTSSQASPTRQRSLQFFSVYVDCHAIQFVLPAHSFLTLINLSVVIRQDDLFVTL